MSWYYWSDERQEAVGPRTEEELLKLSETGAIHLDTRVAQGGESAWRPFREAFPMPLHSENDATNAAQSREVSNVTKEGARSGSILRALTDVLGALISLAGSRSRLLWIALGLLVVLTTGFKVHAKIEKERQNREFRERVIAERRNRPISDYFSLNTVKQCPQCKGTGIVKRTEFPSPGSEWAINDPERCRSCFGRGSFLSASGREVDCNDCNGRGVSPETTCGMCNGKGSVAE